ncbi:hypothetical protein [Vulcanisaeta souniana]|uniref:Uncharacterized protein n=1 Tax=Vulcanisaeta souniana JCM 11219 TaxID=1293586 RepID=A0A830E5R4_9CREN|nr:hypothetical protein [Vulcanisaeta souniana]BDR91401.1 hypothetical protein Vsou_04940 [Vulcanisaeta souniana JCM 11219]GGI72887.1 hypothetical protein GCM10007112_07150 [Vulcanisaeta souniana JCM 11219]
MSIDIPEEIRRIVEEITINKLSDIKGKTETLSFVDSVIEELRKRGINLNDDLEAMVRPYIVDILWTLRKRGTVSMDDDLLHFSVTKQGS